MIRFHTVFLPFRKAQSQDLSVAIRQNILMKYNQHPDIFEGDFQAINALREQAIHDVEPHLNCVNLEPHLNGLKKIMTYACQLAWIAGKFPNDLGVGFIWYPAIGDNREESIALDNLKFEQASILYNLAALYSNLAAFSNQNTSEGLESVCNYFCLSAGVVGYLQEHIIPELQIEPPDDFDDATLEFLKTHLLAQAQESFLRKAVMDGYRDSSIAKLAIKTSDLYGIAGDLCVKCRTILPKWIQFSMAKHYHFAAVAHYRQACDCLDKERYGEEVARLRDSITYTEEGLRVAVRHLNNVAVEELSVLKVKATEDLKRAEKDNDMINLCLVPPKTGLKSIEGVIMAVPKVPLEVLEPLSFLGESKEFGRPLFEKLVPF